MVWLLCGIQNGVGSASQKSCAATPVEDNTHPEGDFKVRFVSTSTTSTTMFKKRNVKASTRRRQASEDVEDVPQATANPNSDEEVEENTLACVFFFRRACVFG